MVCMGLKRLREGVPSYHFKWQIGLYSVKDIWYQTFLKHFVSLVCERKLFLPARSENFSVMSKIFVFVIIHEMAAFQGRPGTPFFSPPLLWSKH